MWQYLLNVILGLVLIIIALVAVWMGTLVRILALFFSLIGVAVVMLSLWGLFDSMERQPHLEHGIDSNI